MVISSIKTEYIMCLISGVFVWFILPYIISHTMNKESGNGWDGLGYAILGVIIYLCINISLAVIFYVINPIRIMIKYHSELSGWGFLLVGLPIPFSLLLIFRVQIGRYLHEKFYYSGKNGYRVETYNYKSAQDFYDDMKARGLAFIEEEHNGLLESMNEKYKMYIEEWNTLNYYTKPVIMGFKWPHSDKFDKTEVIHPGESAKRPVYIYNSIVMLKEKDDELKYAPIARYMDRPGDTKNGFFPFYKDYYIECKILYVDGHLYALIGGGECNSIIECFGEYTRPYYILLSEEDNITTYYEDVYYPDGAIENGYHHVDDLAMHPNKREEKNSITPCYYPVRKVDRVDVDAINEAARELQQNILQKSIKYHFGNK